MSVIVKSKHFKIEELVSPTIVKLVHEDVLWGLLDDRLIQTIDKIKEKFSNGSMSINNYLWSGDRSQSGLRTKDSKYYSEGSQHSIGKAIDCVFSQYNVNEVRNYILTNPDEFPFIGGVELGVSWLHIDVRPRRNGKILTFTP